MKSPTERTGAERSADSWLKSHGCITNFLTIEGVKALMIQNFVGQSVNERAKGVGKKSTGHKSK